MLYAAAHSRAVSAAAIAEASREEASTRGAGKAKLAKSIKEMGEALQANRADYLATLKNLAKHMRVSVAEQELIKKQIAIIEKADFNFETLAARINATIANKLTGDENHDIALANAKEIDAALSLLLRHAVLLKHLQSFI